MATLHQLKLALAQYAKIVIYNEIFKTYMCLLVHLTLSALTYLKYHEFFEVLDIFARNDINKHIYCYEVHQMILGSF